MYVRQLRLHGVKMFQRDIPEDGDTLPDSTRERLLIDGGAGSGKTTILECIRLLWKWFGEWIDRGTQGIDPSRYPIGSTERALFDAELAAVELGDFPKAGEAMCAANGKPLEPSRSPSSHLSSLSCNRQTILPTRFDRSHRNICQARDRPRNKRPLVNPASMM